MRKTIAILCLALAASCGDTAEDHNHGDHDGHSHGEGGHESTGEMTKDTTAGHFTVALTHAGEGPSAGTTTTATLVITKKSDGSAVTGATVTATPNMPAHGHGSSQDPVVVESATPGTYDVTNILYTMSGGWTLDISITSGDMTDSVMFSFDIGS